MKKLAKLSAREEPGVEVGNGEEDLRSAHKTLGELNSKHA